MESASSDRQEGDSARNAGVLDRGVARILHEANRQSETGDIWLELQLCGGGAARRVHSQERDQSDATEVLGDVHMFLPHGTIVERPALPLPPEHRWT